LVNERGNLERWWAEPAETVLERLAVDPQRGLAEQRVDEMRERYGANTMVDTEPAGFRELLWESITSPMILLLLAVAAISLLLGQFAEAIVMAAVVLIYVGVELINKRRTDRTLARLRELQSPRALVIRDGDRRDVAINDIVVGDILPLQPGSRMPADARLLSTVGLLVDEAALTGESTPLPKDADAGVDPDAPLAERPTAVFAGTTVVDGQGRAVVVAVGDASELGQIATLSAEAQQAQTPLQEEMRDLAKTLAYVALVVSLLIPLLGLLRGFGFQEMLLTWLSLTFLMVPGQPPIIITMALALAALELARKDVIVSRLSGAETLGSVTTIVSDKTGTLTENAMSLAAVILPDGEVLQRSEHEGDSRWHTFLAHARRAIPEGSQDPTDGAIIDAVAALDRPPDGEPGRLVDQTGFARSGSHRTLTYASDHGRTRYIAANPDFLLTHATRASEGTTGDDGDGDWPERQREAVRERIEELAAEGYRVTAYAMEPASGDSDQGDGTSADGTIFIGGAVLEDPVRQEVPAAIAALRGAGVRTLLVTGDNAATARHVAGEIGLDTGRVLTGQELEILDQEGWHTRVQDTGVFARTTPEQKLRIVQALQEQGETVAVTGDGVNDAPALRTAHIGVAMGETGTDVAREAADLVLTDDNFAHLPDGVLIGRKAYDNFNKGITYYLSAKAILLSSFLIPLAVGREFPFAPIQIIAIELLMDLASSTIFISESAEPGLMEEAPRERSRFLSWEVARRIVRNLLGLTLALMVVYFGSFALGHDLAAARTAAFATWLLGHIVLAFNLKQRRIPLFRRGLLDNRFAVGWLAGMIALVLAMTLIPAVRDVMDTTALSAAQWGLVVGGALLGSMWMEVLKWVRPPAAG
jgi:P-type Ca2+ transporter type 2C